MKNIANKGARTLEHVLLHFNKENASTIIEKLENIQIGN